MAKRQHALLAILLILIAPALLLIAPLEAQQPRPTLRVLVKVRGTLAQDVESALPITQMSLKPGESGNPIVEGFIGRHSVGRLAPLYPQIVRQKRTEGLSDLEIATRIRQQFAKRGARLRAAFQPPEISRTYVLELDSASQSNLPSVLNDLRTDPDVEYAEEDHLVSVNATENDPYLSSNGSWGQSYPDLWGIQKIGAPAAWNTSTGSGIIVAVVDTGVDYNHPDITANVWTNTKEIPGNGLDDDHNGYVDDVRGWDFIGSSYLNPQQSNNPIDHNGHGTHVAGTIAAVGNNGIGVIGVAWNAKVMAVKALDDSGTGVDSTLGPAIIYAANNGADVISASWGAPGFSQTIADAINYAYNLGAVFVAAAGNNSQDALNFYPAALWNVITVAASDPNDNLASFSNYGSKIDVTAPGVDILSLQASGTQLGPVVSPGYIRLSGTSMATPHVSGLAALILSENPEYSNEEVRQALRSSATDLGTPGYDLSFGYGRANAETALAVNGALEAKISSPADGTVVQGPITITGVARGTGFSHYTLEYGAGALPTTWTTLQTSTTATSGTLGTFDPSSLPDSIYDLRLTAYNTSGQAFVDRVEVVANPIFIQSPAAPSAPTSATTFKNGAVISVTGNAIGANFQNFAVDWAPGLDATSGWQTTGITISGGGTAPVAGGTLAQWDTSSIATAGYYTIRLTVNAANVARQTVTMVYLQPDLLSTTWPQLLPEGTYFSAGVVPALNPDGTLRLVAENPDNGPTPARFWSFTPTGNAQSVLLPGFGSFQQPAVANIDGSPGDEAVVADSNGIDVYKSDESTYRLATTSTLDYTRSQILIDDLLGNSQLETLAVGSNFQNQFAYISAWKSDGTLLNSNFPIRIADQNPLNSWYNRTRLLTADINGDGKKEIVVWEGLSSSTFTLRLFANDGSPLTWSVPVLSGTPEAMAAADLDRNGKLETILVYYSGSQAIMSVFQPDGTTRAGWPVTLPNPNLNSQSFLAVGDLNQDGHKEIVYSHETYLYVFQDNGAVFSSQWPLQTTGFGYASVVIGDVDGDGLPEIVTTINNTESTSDPYFKYGGRYYDEKLLALRKDGTISKSWQLTGGYGFDLYAYPAPAIADLNQDGITDIALAFEVSGSPTAVPGIVEVFSTGAQYNPTLNDWPLIHQNTRNTSALPSSVLGPAAAFLGFDAATQGNWQTKYGSDGYSIANSAQNLPSYAALTPQNALLYTWNASTSDPRALKIPNNSTRIASAWYNGASFTYDVNITDGKAHQIALYALDWDGQARSETIRIVDSANPAHVLDTETVSSYSGGVYLVWNISGHVTISVTTNAGPNAVISGVFFGTSSISAIAPAITSVNTATFTIGTSGTFTVTATGVPAPTFSESGALPNGVTFNASTGVLSGTPAAGSNPSYPVTFTASNGVSPNATQNFTLVVNPSSSPGNTATFVAQDVATEGNWQSSYGSDGYSIANSAQNLPSYATLTPQNALLYTWNASTSDPRAIEIPNSSTGIASAWYNTTSFSFDVAITDGNTHQIALYTLDWDRHARSETIRILDSSNPAHVLDTETITGFSGGTYLVWNISGHVTISVTTNAGPNAVISGVFFGASSISPIAPAITSTNTTTFTIGSSGTFTVTATGVPAPSLSKSGALPNGVTFNTSTGVLSGTPAAGSNPSYPITFTASNRISPDATQNFTLVVNPQSSSPGNTATFVGQDVLTRGNWQTSYGSDGYSIANSAQNLPIYATFTPQNALLYTWNASTSDPRALKTPNGSASIASTWCNTTSFSFDVNITDGNFHQIALYALDWDDRGRAESIQILDADHPGIVLNSESIHTFQNGTYLVWTISGHVTINITTNAGPNSVISGVFFDKTISPAIALSRKSP